MNTPTPLDDDALEAALRRSRTMEDAPEHVIQRAIALFASQAAPAPAASPSLLRRLAAVLSFDSTGSGALAHGLRSSAQGSRQWLYTADGRDIDLRLTSVPGSERPAWRVSGQVLGPDFMGEAELRGEGVNGGVSQVVPWSELAEFRFQPVGAGRWTVLLRGDDWEIELPVIDITASE